MGPSLRGGGQSQSLGRWPLAQAYKRHERSREAIELAYEAILSQDMKKRQKYGFKPPKLGRRTDADAEPEARPEP